MLAQSRTKLAFTTAIHLYLGDNLVVDRQMTKEKRNTSLRLDSKTLKELKLAALEEDSSVQKILEKLVKNYLKKRQKKRAEQAVPLD